MTTRTFTLVFPAGMPLLNSNQRLHHAPRARLTDKIRGKSSELCSEHPLLRAELAASGAAPVMRHAYILGIVHPQKLGRFDPANFYPSFKAAVDGLVDAGVLEDDDFTRIVGPDMRPGPKVKGGQIALLVQEITPEQHAGFQWQGLPAEKDYAA